MGGKTDWVREKLTSQIFPRGKKLTGQFFPGERMGQPILSPGKKLTGEKTDRYTGLPYYAMTNCVVVFNCFLLSKIYFINR